MSEMFLERLAQLRADYADVAGRPFSSFFCPILFVDQDVELCRAHIINLGFPGSSPEWTIQRRDVDVFFGSVFESEFLAIRYREGGSIEDVIADTKLTRQLRPQVLLDGNPVPFFASEGPTPTQFTRVGFESAHRVVDLSLKIRPKDFESAMAGKWEIAFSDDVRIPALASLLKAAHLTLFHLLGYRYALSAGGYFLGRQVLGEFFAANKHHSKRTALDNAKSHFGEFLHLVRPIPSPPTGLEGSLTDGNFLLCALPNGSFWALITFIRTSTLLHAVLTPVIDDADTAARFAAFLVDETEDLAVCHCRFADSHWEVSSRSSIIHWPKRGITFP